MRASVLLRQSALVCVLLACLGTKVTQAASEDVSSEQERNAMKAEVESQTQTLLSSPAGIFDVEYVDGQLVRLKIKGESEVPTSLQGARADRFAREKAERGAKAAFSKFLNEQVTVVESDTEGVMIRQKDGKESAEVLDASQRTVTTFSNSFLRGLIVLLAAR